MEKKPYLTPETVMLGSVVEVTRGTSTSSLWDMGSGRKSGCGGGGSSNDPLNPC